MSEDNDSSIKHKIQRKLLGKPKDIHDPAIFHKISLIPLLAWIGLGADGLSSSSYGPEEAFRALGSHTSIALFLALATSITVFVISYAYSRIIEHFPTGGGGYIVATHTLGEKAGVLSGCALLVDYMLTITVSIVSCGDALFSFLPLSFQQYKIIFEFTIIMVLLVMNLRGAKESITLLAPIFIVFIVTHVLLIGYGILSHLPQVGEVAQEIKINLKDSFKALGTVGVLGLFLRAYSLGGGTYTGIEAVSNGLQIMREPKVQTGKRTMLYMSTSLAFMASGLFICYLLLKIIPTSGRTLNAILAQNVFGNWPLGYALALVTILSEGALLMVGAQAGFIDGPRVMSNMAVDSWLPHRFATLSERLTMKNGIMLMGGAAILLLVYTRGSISHLVVMYSINVFLTFSISELGMSTYFIRNRRREKLWKKHLPVHITGFVLCLTILIITSYEKFREGGWLTLIITFSFIIVCYLIHGHYKRVSNKIRQMDELLTDIPTTRKPNTEPVSPKESTAILLVSSYSGFGIHILLSILRNFRGSYRNFIFTSVAVVDSGAFKGASEIQNLEKSVKDSLVKYVELARKLGFPAEYRMVSGTDVIDAAVDLCRNIKQEFPHSTVFTGSLIFKQEKFIHKLLHNETAYAIQRRLHWDEIPTVIIPIRLFY
ncbi:MAG: APC family permease [Candidatus Aminicenantes bacterium]|nr:APC family permease [Candidatus Aminicenantes bacterium]